MIHHGQRLSLRRVLPGRSWWVRNAEAAAGDPAAARERLAVLKDLPQFDITDDVALLAGALVASMALPAKAPTEN